MDSQFLKKILLDKVEKKNRTLTIEKYIFTDYSQNKIVISVEPDDYIYEIPIKLEAQKDNPNRIYVCLSDIDPQSEYALMFSIFKKPEKISKNDPPVKVLFEGFEQIGKKLGTYKYPLVLIKDEEIVIEKLMHDIFQTYQKNPKVLVYEIKKLIFNTYSLLRNKFVKGK